MMSVQLAQGWRAHHDTMFDSITGFNGEFSDYVGRVVFNPGANLSISDRFRLDRSNLSPKRNESNLSIGPPMLRASVQYYYFEKSSPEATAAFGRRQQLYYTLSSELSRYWTISGTYQTDLSSDTGGPLGWSGNLTYNDECFALVSKVMRNYTYNNDYLAGITVSVNIVLKTFGQLPYTLFSN
jgi:LPS-assembly protein